MNLNNYTLPLLRTALVLICVSIVHTTIDAQKNAQYIYGTILTEAGDSYEGFMRWGTEEVAWHDTFNSTKTKSKPKIRSKSNDWSWGDMDWSLSSLWKDKYSGSNHTFACRYGDISALELGRGDKVNIKLKNGSEIKVNGGSNDIGATIRLYDYELGLIKFDWDRIETITFSQAPSAARARYEGLIYGTATTYKGDEYTGYVKWDNDERILEDELDGDSRNGDQSIPFTSIKRIEKDRKGSTVWFQSGRKIELSGTNDVDDGNRGVIVYSEGIGEIEIPWGSFEALDFEAAPVGPNYTEFASPVELQGTVQMYNGDEHVGHIIFDLDEMWDMEFLDGMDGDIDYKIPFRNVKKITPKNRSFSRVELRNGDKLLLSDTQDVSDRNDGLLIFNSESDKPIKASWDDIDEIIFN